MASEKEYVQPRSDQEPPEIRNALDGGEPIGFEVVREESDEAADEDE
jgi:hypothetical protein